MTGSAPSSRLQRVVAYLEADGKRRYWILILFLAALVVRLHWNLSVHPLGEYIYSDMKGYWSRADANLDHPFSSREYDAFFPFGTAWLVTGIKFVFGRENITAFAVLYAIFGALIVAMSFEITHRAIGDRVRWVAPAVGLLLVVYYPLIAIGGYVLSEVPYSLALVTCIYLLLRLVDEGKNRQAWLLGLMLGIATLIRPQMLMGVALVGLYWLFARLRQGAESPYNKLTWGHIARIAVPLMLLLVMASARFHLHTGRYGLISENSSINLVFGRCHNKGLYSRPDGAGHGTVRFSPPPLIQFEAYSAAHPDALIQIRSVWGDDDSPVEGVPGFAVDSFGCTRRPCRQPGSEIEYRGYIGDTKLQKKIVRACLERGGVKRQAYFSFTHWILLWRHNLMWPDQANPRPRSTEGSEGWRQRQIVWARIHRGLIMIPALLGLGFVFMRRREPRAALVALNFWALMIVTSIWIGGMRFRVPYDPVLAIMAGLTYGVAWERVVAWSRRRRAAKRGAQADTGAEPDTASDGSDGAA